MVVRMADDPILTRVRDALRDMYGDNIDRIVLFGSRARGDAREDSDYDVAVFLKTLVDRAAERRRLGLLRFDVMEETGQFLDIKAFAADQYHERTGFMRDVRRQGAAL